MGKICLTECVVWLTRTKQLQMGQLQTFISLFLLVLWVVKKWLTSLSELGFVLNIRTRKVSAAFKVNITHATPINHVTISNYVGDTSESSNFEKLQSHLFECLIRDSSPIPSLEQIILLTK